MTNLNRERGLFGAMLNRDQLPPNLAETKLGMFSIPSVEERIIAKSEELAKNARAIQQSTDPDLCMRLRQRNRVLAGDITNLVM
ncbi:MAG: hypothetical protein OXG05_08320 [Gammaproteobacteria bacterium]|nr:hypothetical protein [Gammaproteobacteria bacterium]